MGVLCVCFSFVSCIMAMWILCWCIKCLSSMCLLRIPSMFNCSMLMLRRSFLGMFVLSVGFLGLFGGGVWWLFVGGGVGGVGSCVWGPVLVVSCVGRTGGACGVGACWGRVLWYNKQVQFLVHSVSVLSVVQRRCIHLLQELQQTEPPPAREDVIRVSHMGQV